ncbi:hypothetical protein SAMN05421686_104106 [Thalassolituus maritimus]|uniref:O-Antigen ligase n=1 Tax=Thalassolituus maritimus TaxID=484498 RepID=A0A1N7LNA4_9GAMM|nr:hypothetical protein [Thalassolituus maritimus]SIS75300.1 hypothetical protein SAMN05421686_104106 [Thalassolituus maritimus]
MQLKYSWLSMMQLYILIHVASAVIVSLFVSGFSALPYTRLVYILLYTGVCLVFIFRVRDKVYVDHTSFFSKVFLIYIYCFPLWLFMGVLDFGFYVITDAYYFLFGILVFYAFYNSIFYLHDLSIENLIFLKGTVVVGLLLVLIRYLSFSVPMEVVVALSTYIVIYIFHGVSQFWRFIFLFLIVLLAMTSNRAFFLQAIVVSYVLILARFGVVRTVLVTALMWFLVLLSVNVFSHDIKEMFSGTPLDRRVSETLSILEGKSIEEVSLPLMQREYEASQVRNFFVENPLYIIAGKGFGATLDMSASEDDSVIGSQFIGAEDTHNIHYLHYAILYRHGVVGCILIALIILASTRFLYRCSCQFSRSNINFLQIWGSAIVIAMFSFSIFASSFIFSNPLWIMGLAAMVYYERRVFV